MAFFGLGLDLTAITRPSPTNRLASHFVGLASHFVALAPAKIRTWLVLLTPLLGLQERILYDRYLVLDSLEVPAAPFLTQSSYSHNYLSTSRLITGALSFLPQATWLVSLNKYIAPQCFHSHKRDPRSCSDHFKNLQPMTAWTGFQTKIAVCIYLVRFYCLLLVYMFLCSLNHTVATSEGSSRSRRR